MYRKNQKVLRDKYKETSKADFEFYERLQKIIKIIANAISYGIYVEVRVYDKPDKTLVDIFDLKQFQVAHSSVVNIKCVYTNNILHLNNFIQRKIKIL